MPVSINATPRIRGLVLQAQFSFHFDMLCGAIVSGIFMTGNFSIGTKKEEVGPVLQS